MSDLKYALRQLLKHRAFAAAVVLAVALVLGVGGELAGGRLLGSLLFGVLTVALLACWIPARRAGADPSHGGAAL